MKRAKRVRFNHNLSDRPKSGRSENVSAPSISTEGPSCNPKTSEFAYFKKFMEEATLKLPSKSPPRENIQLKCSAEKNHGGGDTDDKNISSSSCFTENARPGKIDTPQFVSSSLIKTSRRRNQEEDIRTPRSSGSDGFILERATESVRSDTRYTDGDIFSKKRAKLQSLAAKAMNPGIGEILTGRDLISRLLNRLIPESSGTYHCEGIKPKPHKEKTEFQPLCLPESSHQLKESWNESERKLAKRKKPYFTDVDASSSLSSIIHQSFLLEEPAQSDPLPAHGHQYKDIEPCYFSSIDFNQSWNGNSKTDRQKTLDGPYESIPEDQASDFVYGNRRMAQSARLPVLGHKYKDIEPCYFSKTDFNQSWNGNSKTDRQKTLEGPFKSIPEDQASDFVYGNRFSFDSGRMTLEHDSVQEHFLNDGPFTTNNYGTRFLLEFEKEPEPSLEINSGSMFGYSPGSHRSSRLTAFFESDESDDDLRPLRSRKTSNLLLGWDNDKPKTKEIRYSSPVDTGSDSPLMIPCEIIPAVEANFFDFSTRQECLFPKRTYFPAIEAPVGANSNPYLLLEGGEDECIGDIHSGYSTISPF